MNNFDQNNYELLLANKTEEVKKTLQQFNIPEISVYASPPLHYRMRAEFRLWKENNQNFYAMFDSLTKKPIFVEQFPIANKKINELMIALKSELEENNILNHKLFQVEFLTGSTNDALITLCYHRKLDELWLKQAQNLSEKIHCKIIGRAKNQRLVLDDDFIIEKIKIKEKDYIYKQVEGSFSQPNIAINQKMIHWILQQCQNKNDDLLELYCGNGNFTIPLASCFRKVLATEISKKSINALEYNIKINKINNLKYARLAANEIMQALNKIREFKRLEHVDLDEYDFQSILVDPPRSGLDLEACQWLQNFNNVIYISCSLESLSQNLQILSKTHHIQACALFDQFPYTKHIETGIILKKK